MTTETTAVGNDSWQDPDELVQQIQDSIARVLLPLTVYIAVLAFTGLIGNAMVIYYYGWKTKTSPTSVFIIMLAMYDIFSCALSVPTEIVDTVMFFTFTAGPACRILRFLSYFLSLASGLTLVLISIDRYKHIRRASGNQINVTMAKKYCGVVAVMGVILACPSLALFDAVYVPVPNDYGRNLTGQDCTFVTDPSYQPFKTAFNILLAISFLVSVIILSSLYGMVAWTIYKHRRRLAKSTNISSADTSMLHSPHCKEQSRGTSIEELQTSDSGLGQGDESYELQRDHTERRIFSSKKSRDKKTDRKARKPTFAGSKRRSRETVRVTFLMTSITIVFIVSFLPYLSVLTWLNVTGQQWWEFSDSELVGYTMGAWSFLYNSCLNPWIYGIFNSQFRQFYYNIVCCRTK